MRISVWVPRLAHFCYSRNRWTFSARCKCVRLPFAQHEHGSLGEDVDGRGGDDMHGDDDDDEEDMSHDEGEEDDDDDDDDVIDDEILDASGRHDDDRDVALGVRRLQARFGWSHAILRKPLYEACCGL